MSQEVGQTELQATNAAAARRAAEAHQGGGDAPRRSCRWRRWLRLRRRRRRVCASAGSVCGIVFNDTNGNGIQDARRNPASDRRRWSLVCQARANGHGLRPTRDRIWTRRLLRSPSATDLHGGGPHTDGTSAPPRSATIRRLFTERRRITASRGNGSDPNGYPSSFGFVTIRGG